MDIKRVITTNFDFIKFKLSYELFKNSNSLLANTIYSFQSSNEDISIDYDVSSIPVLLYHGIINNEDRFSISKDRFFDHISSLKKAGWHTVSLSDLESFNRGEKELDDKSFVLTFDDGRVDSYKNADPILKAVGYNAVMYIAVNSSIKSEDEKKSTYYIGNEDIKNMINSGRWEIGSHAIQESGGYVTISEDGEKGNFLSNKKFTNLDSYLESDEEYKARINRELVSSKETIEDSFGININSFSYPFGDYGQQSINNPNAVDLISDIVQKNYSIAFKQVWEKDGEFTFNHSYSNPYLLKRIEVQTDFSGQDLLKYLDNGKDKIIPITDDFSNDIGWKNNWGKYSIEQNQMYLEADENSSGSSVFLDGTRSLKNYLYSLDVIWKKGSNLSLMSHYNDSKNYVVCNFSNSRVRIEKYTNGVPKILSDSENFLDVATTSSVTLSMLVDGDFSKCLIGQKVVAYATIPDSDGGVGIKVWDKVLGDAAIVINKVNIIDIKDAKDYISRLYDYKNKVEVVKKTIIKKQPIIINNNEVKTPTSLSTSTLPTKKQIDKINLFGDNGELITYNVDLSLENVWDNLYGSLYLKDNSLFIGANASTTSSMAVLLGTDRLKNYTFKINATWYKGSSFTLVARYKDQKNYVGCSFSEYGRSVRLFYVINGETKNLGQSPQLGIPYMSPWENNNLSIVVDGDRVECHRNNVWVLKGQIKNIEPLGGVGLKTYDKTLGYSLIAIKKMSITAIPE
jgi:peptidoglycan/xylan/chitin deacetylase (PgdA/CDA1 family)